MNEDASLKVLANDISYIKKDISEIKDSIKDLSDKYVTKEEFAPIKNIVYGMVGLILTAALVAMMKFIFIK